MYCTDNTLKISFRFGSNSYWKPTVDENGDISWEASASSAPPETVNIKGVKGDKGDKGDTGEKGEKGDTGAKGDKGDTGAKGDTGDTGVSVVSAGIDASGHLIITLSDESTIDAGEVKDLTAESTGNKVTELSASSTDTEYPSAKCVYDMIGDVESLLGGLL